MDKFLLGITCFGLGFAAGTFYFHNEEQIQDIVANEKKAIDKFKKNPKNKGFLKIFNKK